MKNKCHVVEVDAKKKKISDLEDTLKEKNIYIHRKNQIINTQQADLQ